MPVALPDPARALLDAPQYAVLATIEADGSPQLSVVWAARDGDDVLVSTIEGRRKHTNLVRDPRCALLVLDGADPDRFAEVRGSARITRAGGRELIDRLAHEYDGVDRFTGDDDTDRVRVVVRIAAEHVVVREG
jgi:PPOX class probable F420-dependent enzyme